MDIKHCPFCGSQDVESRPKGECVDGNPWSMYYVHCNLCNADGPIIQIYDFDVPAKACRDASIDLWNWRVK